MFSYFKKSEKKFTTRGLFISAMSHVKLITETRVYICHKKNETYGVFLQCFESFGRKIYKNYSTGNEEWIEFETANFISSVTDKTNARTPKKRKILLFFFNSKRYRDFSQATILKRLLSNSSCVPQSFFCY